LLAVGACAALTSSGSGYNSGFSLGRGITLAYLVSHELGGQPVPSTSLAGTHEL
jgi:3-oxosteroid 1-dehydrogenase